MELLKGDALIEYAESIENKSEFDYFLKCFIAECASRSPEWENTNLLDFLSGLAEFSYGMQAYFNNRDLDLDASIPTWRNFAEILIAGTICD